MPNGMARRERPAWLHGHNCGASQSCSLAIQSSALGRRILPKAEDEATARQLPQAAVRTPPPGAVSAIALIATPMARCASALSETIVRFKAAVSEQDIDAYVAGGEWHGKAGGYAIQGSAEG